MHIMNYMSGKTAATLMGFVGAAALGIFIESRRARKARTGIQVEPKSSASSPEQINIDDDAAAEIIRRAKSEFERARELYAY
jgi:hypothetical protein